jgi:hypothetical protein
MEACQTNETSISTKESVVFSPNPALFPQPWNLPVLQLPDGSNSPPRRCPGGFAERIKKQINAFRQKDLETVYPLRGRTSTRSRTWNAPMTFLSLFLTAAPLAPFAAQPRKLIQRLPGPESTAGLRFRPATAPAKPPSRRS